MELEDRFPEEAAEAAWAAQEVEPYPDDGDYPEAPISPEFRKRLIAAVERPLRVRREILLLAAHACGHLCGPDRGCRTCHRDWPCEAVRRAAAPALEAFADTADDPAVGLPTEPQEDEL